MWELLLIIFSWSLVSLRSVSAATDKNEAVQVVLSQWWPRQQSSTSGGINPASMLLFYQCLVNGVEHDELKHAENVQKLCERTIENGQSRLDSSISAAGKDATLRTVSLDFLASHPSVTASIPERLLKQMPRLIAWQGDSDDNQLELSTAKDELDRNETEHGWTYFEWNQGQDKKGRWTDYSLSNDEEDAQRIDFSLESRLSETGGMHPQLSHHLNVKLATAHGSVVKGESVTSFSALIWVDIPPTVFVNVEDAFLRPASNDVASQNITIQMIHNENVVIDQEEPSFAKPQHHAIFYLIHGSFPLVQSGDQGTVPETLFQLQWNTLLHIRYQTPADDGQRIISIMSPSVVAAVVTDESRMTQQSFASFLPKSPQISHSVATGKASHFIPVLLVTILVSIGGTLILLRELSLYHHQTKVKDS